MATQADARARALAPQPGARTRHDMKVQVMHLLATLFAGVGDDPKASLRIGFGTLREGQLGRQREHAPDQGLVFRTNMGHRDDVDLGNDQKMNRRPRVDVVKGQNLVVFVDFARRNLARDDFAKYAIS